MTIMQRFFWLSAISGLFINICLLPVWSAALYFLGLFVSYTILGLYDLYFSSHTLCRIYPVVGHLRYLLEYVRPEIQQYFIASNTSERPFNREERSLVYRRAKDVTATLPFGTELDLYDTGFLSAQHSLQPTVVKTEHERVLVGGEDCKKPYLASRLNISAMSFGSLSANAIRALNRGAKQGGFSHNTGEGSVSPHHVIEGGDIVWQIGTGYFGCRTKEGTFDADLFKQKSCTEQIKMIEIKLSQGAKPAHGGLLPAAKINSEIAMIRGIHEGEDCHSPARHSAFNSPVELLEFVARLRELSGGKPVGFKLCIGVRSEFMSICKAMLKTGITPDFITVDGAEGGTGAAPMEFSNRLGTPCHEGVYFVHNCLKGCGLREKIKVIASGKTASGFHILTKIALGADMVNAARTMMLAMGCIQARSCNTNHCPTGIATQDEARSKAINITDKGERVAHYQRKTLCSFFNLVGAMGLENPDKLCAKHLLRRTDDETTKTYDEIYCPLDDGALLKNDALEGRPARHYANDWLQASAEQF